MGEEQQKKRWVEHFEELLNRSLPQNPPVILPAAQDLDIQSSILTRDEIRMAIRQLKSGKAPGPDGIPCEGRYRDHCRYVIPPLREDLGSGRSAT